MTQKSVIFDGFLIATLVGSDHRTNFCFMTVSEAVVRENEKG